ncbi:MAG TPA: MFS transporter [Chloroflexota bacterium]|nr:MFS transporter [Chloroflexota bacterium]
MRLVGNGPWSMRLVYFCYFFGSASYITFAVLYWRSIHLSGAQIGLIASIGPLAGLAMQPAWGFLSDRYRLRTRLLGAGLLTSALVAPALLLSHRFVLIVLLVVALAIALSPIIPLADATTLEWVQRHGGTYGGIRVFGSLAFVVGSLVAGPLLGGGRIALVFPFFGGALALAFLAALAAPRQETPGHARHVEGMGSLLRQRRLLLFLVLAGIGFGTAASYNTFFALYMHDVGAGTGIIGIAAAMASSSELPVMAFSGRLIARLGVKRLLMIGLGAGAARWLWYGLVHDYRLALIAQVFHGLSFAASYVAGITYMDLHVPSHLRSTGQTLFYASTFGIGTIAGANLFGSLLSTLGIHGIYILAGALATVSVAGIGVFVPGGQEPSHEEGLADAGLSRGAS